MAASAHPCPLCGAATTAPFLDRAAVPVHQHLLMESQAQAQAMPRGRLWMWCCAACGFAFNAAFEPSLLQYDASYENAQTYSPAFSEHVDALVEHLVREAGVRDGRVVEVGCGDGTFLRRLVEHPGSNVTAHGFDPSYEGPREACDGRLVIERRFYDAAAAVPADVVICRHLIEHVQSPLALLRTVHDAVAASAHARVYFETPCLRWILEQVVLWDLFYEHCSLFTADALRTAFERTGFAVERTRHVFGGQYLWIAARRAAHVASPHADASDLPDLARRFADVEHARVAAWQQHLERWRAEGRVVLHGAGAKGVTFANLADPHRRWIDAVIDINPAKQGRYLPGTGHAIHSPERLREQSAALVLVTNPNYLSEIRRTVALFGSDARVVDLMQVE